MRGSGGVYKRGSVYWIRYHHRGREYRETSRSSERADAVSLLRQRLADASRGNPGGPAEERLTFDVMAADYIEERRLKGVPAERLQWSKARVTHLRTFFTGMRAADITTLTMRDYAKRRLAGGATPGTVNRDFGVLSCARRPIVISQIGAS